MKKILSKVLIGLLVILTVVTSSAIIINKDNSTVVHAAKCYETTDYCSVCNGTGYICDDCGWESDGNGKCADCGSTNLKECANCNGRGYYYLECEYHYYYNYDSTKHWKECGICGNKANEGNHEFDANGKCTVCDYQKPSTCTVKFNLNGGSSTTTIDDLTKKSVNDNIEFPSQGIYGITKSGYKFLGWAKTNSETEALSSYSITTDDVSSGTITLYAVWEKETYSITYYNVTDATNPNTVETYQVDTETITLSDASKNDYTFLGWYTEDNGGGTQVTQIVKGTTGNQTLYAYFKKTFTFTTTKQEYTYDKKDHSFVLKGYDTSKSPTIKIEYAEHNDSLDSPNWQTNVLPQNVGLYDVRVSGYDNDYGIYADFSVVLSSALEITPKEVSIEWENLSLGYTGSAIKPTAKPVGLLSDFNGIIDECTFTISGEQTEIGTGYTATVTGLSNANYKLPSDVTTTFSIKYDIKINETKQFVNVEDDTIAFNITGDNIPDSGMVVEYKAGYDNYSSDYINNHKYSMEFYVKVSFAGDETHNSFTKEIPNGLTIYYSVIYCDDGATSGTAPVDDTKHVGSGSFSSKTNTGNLEKTGYEFDGWLYCYSNPNYLDEIKHINAGQFLIPNYLSGSKITGNIYAYPCWKISVEDLSSSNKYTVTPANGATLDGCQYQWYENVIIHMNDPEEDDYTITYGTFENYSYAELDISDCDADYIYVKTNKALDAEFTEYEEKIGDYYKISSEESIISIVCNQSGLEVLDLYYFGSKEITNETSKSIKNIEEGSSAYCVIKNPNVINNVTYYSETITNEATLYSIVFNRNVTTDDESSSVYAFGSTSITIPSNSFYNKGYVFDSWNTESNGSGTSYNEGDKYTVESSITLYAIWAEKDTLSITETAQEKTYSGSSLSFEIKGTSLDTSSFKIEYKVGGAWTETAPIVAGSYDIKITRSEDNTYKAYSKEIPNGLKINKAKVTLPTVNNNLIYSGSSITGVALPDGALYKLSDNTGSNAGDYTATAKLTDSSNYEWNLETPVSTDQSIVWSIAKAQAVITVDTTPIVKTYGETVTVPTATTTFGTVSCDKTSADLVNAGTYTITYTVDSTSNFDGATKTVSVTINTAKVSEPTILVNSFMYDGFEHEVTITSAESFMTKSSDSVTKATSKGVYTITYTLDSNHEWADGSDGTITWSIGVGLTSITLSNESNITKVYGESFNLPIAESNFGEVSCDKTLADLVNVGTYTVTYSVPGTNDYSSATKSITVTITKAQAVITVDTTPIVKTYGEVVVVPTATTTFGSVSCDKTSANLVNAGTYTITYTVSGNSNYDGATKSVSVTINKKNVNVNWKDLTYVYSGNTQTISASYTNLDGEVVELNVTTNNEFKEVGVYTASAAFKNGETNYNLVLNTKTYEIIESKEIEFKDEVTEENNENKVEIIAGSIDISIKVVIDEDDTEDESILENIKNAISKASEIIAKFEIHLEDQNGVKVENIDGNKYKVTLTIPEELRGRQGYAIVYINTEDNTVEKFDSESTDSTIVFTTTHFSTWAIVADEESSIWIIIPIILGSLLIIFIGLFIIWKIEYDKAEKENDLDDRSLYKLDPIYLPINKLLNKLLMKEETE